MDVRGHWMLGVVVGLLLGAAPAQARDYDGGKAFFTTPIAGDAATDPRSGDWVAGMRNASRYPYVNGPTNLFAPPVYDVTSSTPERIVRCRFCGAYTGTGETKYEDRVTVPIPDGAIPDPSEDGHIAFVDRARGLEWNLINAHDNGDGTWRAGGAGQFSLAGDGHQNVALGGGSATGSHLPLSQAISTDEVQAAIADGSYLIPHALQFGAPNIDGRCWVYPALGSDGNVRGGLPEGARIQLDPLLDVSTLPPGPRVLARTLQVYGAYLRDLSGAFAFYLRPQRGSAPAWSTLGIDGDALQTIPTERFRVLTVNYATIGTDQPKVQRPDRSCGPGADQVAPQQQRGSSTVQGAGTTTGSGGSTTRPGAADRARGARPLAPRNLFVRVRDVRGIRRVQFVWYARQSQSEVPRYRLYVDGKLRATVSRTYTGYLRIPPGRHVATVAGVSRTGVVGVRRAPGVRFTVPG
ncbi:hypothetical protein GKE82_15580 [Conexibacter sp. W3-3-2]|uniref:hypothetical protein n=1 Tax=Conexibacter sp. W3-3-2 TaxID=2675227 RepID=UPI0012B8D7DF|nr:hypothetical protein [Conexibacter sp. W3-3-2]MTD45668.1 hypothetical protein [Conexibacter sp. W3-3-2]